MLRNALLHNTCSVMYNIYDTHTHICTYSYTTRIHTNTHTLAYTHTTNKCIHTQTTHTHTYKEHTHTYTHITHSHTHTNPLIHTHFSGVHESIHYRRLRNQVVKFPCRQRRENKTHSILYKMVCVQQQLLLM